MDNSSHGPETASVFTSPPSGSPLLARDSDAHADTVGPHRGEAAAVGRLERARSALEHTAQTVACENIRAVAAGVLESASSTFLVLLAVTHFGAPPAAKGLLAATGSLGFLFAPLTVVVTQRAGRSPSAVAALCFAAAAVAFVPALFTDSIWIFTASTTAAMAFANGTIALVTDMYQQNYPRAIRGRLLARTIMVRILAVSGFSYLGGRMAELPVIGTRLLIASFLAATLVSSACLLRCNTRPIGETRSPLSPATLAEVWHHRLFRNTMICWMIMGFGNLMMVALRVEYLANPAYGLALTPASVALFTGVLPNLARFAFSRFWGRLFDQMNFFVLRSLLNVCFALSILAFFATDSTTGLVIGALIFGAATAGGDIAWSLWVAKFARADRVASYMSLHAFLTGVRGILAPLVAFHLLTVCSVTVVAWIAAAIVVAANIWMVPELRNRTPEV